MAEHMQTINGAYTLHDFRKFNWKKWQLISNERQEEVWADFQVFLKEWESEMFSFNMYHILGEKTDFLFLCLSEHLETIQAFETALNKSLIGSFLQANYSYLAMVEKNIYGREKVDLSTDPSLKASLYPEIPQAAYICFYPMARDRTADENWFSLSQKKRGELMAEHINSVKSFNSQVKRLVTGSIGFEQYDWGISLFANEAEMFKNMFHQSRYDEVVAKYTLYGNFYIGSFITKEKMQLILDV